MSPMIIGLVVLALLVFYVISIYNNLVKLRIRRENAFADIDVQLKQRHDLIPQLVNTVKGYMQHEEGVLTKITNARSRAMSAGSIDEKIAAENDLSRAMGSFNIQVEAYPDLKANQNFMQLQGEISDIETNLQQCADFSIQPPRSLIQPFRCFLAIFLQVCLVLKQSVCSTLVRSVLQWKRHLKLNFNF
jgi:LemA protein